MSAKITKEVVKMVPRYPSLHWVLSAKSKMMVDGTEDVVKNILYDYAESGLVEENWQDTCLAEHTTIIREVPKLMVYAVCSAEPIDGR